MLTGKLDILQSYTGVKTFSTIADFNLNALQGIHPIGEWIFIDSLPGVKALVLNRSNDSDAVKEFHRLFIDIHMPLRGSDHFYLAGEITAAVQPYQQETDCSLVKAATLQEVSLAVGDFMLLEPEEIHCNVLKEDSLKTVIKLPYPWQKL